MTHGAGAISYGGGSGGGGFSSGMTFTTYYSHGHRRRRDDNSDDKPCCCALCYLLFFLLCLVKMKPRTRIILTWLYCIVGACVTGGLIARHYNSRDLTASPTDIRKVDHVSSLFCESVLIDSSSLITTYRFNSEPKINKTSSFKYDKSVPMTIKRGRYEYWGFYLLAGSMITIHTCPDGLLSFYIIRGKRHLDDWLNDASCDCYQYQYTIFSCSGDPNAFQTTFTASISDQYYFLFANEEYFVTPPEPVEASVNFSLDRKLYEAVDFVTVCENKFDCNVQLSGTESIVYYIPGHLSFDIAITIYCEPRIYLYICLFAILPIAIGTFMTVFVTWLSRRKNQRSRSENQIFTTSTSESLQGFANENSTINISPPSYSEAPPSYDEAISS